jgi:hypothetical protein
MICALKFFDTDEKASLESSPLPYLVVHPTFVSDVANLLIP